MRTIFVMAAVLLAACTYETTSYRPESESEALLDDTAPSSPERDEALTFDGYKNRSRSTFRFDVAGFKDDAEKAEAAVLYASHGAFLKANGGGLDVRIPSVQTVGTWAKQLDDTIYAGVELATISSKHALLAEVLAWLLEHRDAAHDEAAIVVASALRLGGENAAMPSELEGSVQASMAEFNNTPGLSKPLGFYTWSDELAQVWRQDRFLQQKLTPMPACALAEAIASDATRRENYEALLTLYSRLTNPLLATLLERLDTTGQACLDVTVPGSFLSASTSAEYELFEDLYPYGVPPGANLMQDLITAIRNGTVDLTPGENAGWYAWQTYALETMLVTDKSEERQKVAFTAKYKKRLQEAFSSMLVQHRETHVRQLAIGPTPPSVEPEPQHPEFTVEPMATVYVRHARSYTFLEQALDAIYGNAFLDDAHAVGAGGQESETLRQRLHRARDFFFAMYVRSALELGFRPQLVAGEPDEGDWANLATAATGEWLTELKEGPFANADVRVIVPIASIDKDHMKYWAVIGVRATVASYSYIEAPDVHDELEPWRVALATEQFIEYVGSSNPPTREEFRALCDQHKTAKAIQTALEAR